MPTLKLTFCTVEGTRFYETFEAGTSVGQIINFLEDKYNQAGETGAANHKPNPKPNLRICSSNYFSFDEVKCARQIDSNEVCPPGHDVTETVILILSRFIISAKSKNIIPPPPVRDLQRNTEYAKQYLAEKMRNNPKFAGTKNTEIIFTETQKLKNDLSSLMIKNKSVKRAICILNDGHSTTFDFLIAYNPSTKKREISSCVVLDSIDEIDTPRSKILEEFNIPVYLLTSTVCNLHSENLEVYNNPIPDTPQTDPISYQHAQFNRKNNMKNGSAYAFCKVDEHGEAWIFIHSAVVYYHGRHSDSHYEEVKDKNLIALLKAYNGTPAEKQKLISEAIYHHTSFISAVSMQKDATSCFYYALHFATQAAKTSNLHSKCEKFKALGRNTVKILSQKNQNYHGLVSAIPYSIMDFGFIKHTQSNTLLRAFNHYPLHQITQTEQLHINAYLKDHGRPSQIRASLENKARQKVKQ